MYFLKNSNKQSASLLVKHNIATLLALFFLIKFILFFFNFIKIELFSFLEIGIRLQLLVSIKSLLSVL